MTCFVSVTLRGKGGEGKEDWTDRRVVLIMITLWTSVPDRETDPIGWRLRDSTQVREIY